MKKIRYKLYAMPLSQDNLQTVEQERFYMVCPTHILVYRKPWRKTPETAKMVPAGTHLSDKEEAWLRDCNLTIMREFAGSHEESAVPKMQDFLGRFERELAMEREKLQQSTSASGGESVTMPDREEGGKQL